MRLSRFDFITVSSATSEQQGVHVVCYTRKYMEGKPKSPYHDQWEHSCANGAVRRSNKPHTHVQIKLRTADTHFLHRLCTEKKACSIASATASLSLNFAYDSALPVSALECASRSQRNLENVTCPTVSRTAPPVTLFLASSDRIHEQSKKRLPQSRISFFFSLL